MPGVIMDKANVGGTNWEFDADDLRYGRASFASAGDVADPPNFKADLSHVNGALGATNTSASGLKTSTVDTRLSVRGPPPDLVHITQGFFPFTKLVNRAVQQCWNDLSDLVTELAEIQISSQGQSSVSIPVNGKPLDSQSPGNVQKKLQILNFAHDKRAEFIKLLVLSQWSRQALDVSKLIDVQGFIRSRHQAYAGALQMLGEMKRGLVMAQVANPDLKTALEVLTKGRVTAMSDLGYKPPRPLTAKSTLKTLRELNRIIAVRLALYDQLPCAFRSYRIHDGRVTFHVPGEFELDLSVGDKNVTSQFFFVDIRFLFFPASPVPKGWALNELDMKVNSVLHDRGLAGCFDFLHNLTLTNKVQIYYKQAVSLVRSLWSDALHIELLHRTLVVQYWISRPGTKSWIEIGVKSGRRQADGVSVLGIRWMRDDDEVSSEDIHFDSTTISMECVLRSVISLHISYMLVSAYTKFSKSLLFAAGGLSLQARLSRAEPADCELNIQLTTSRQLRVSVEPASGASVFSTSPGALERPEGDRGSDKDPINDIVLRVSRLRCVAAIEEVEWNMKMLGFEIINPRSLRIDIRKIFPSNVLRFSFFSHQLWRRSWVLVATSSMDSDNWWLIPFRSATPKRTGPPTSPPLDTFAQVISTSFYLPERPLSHESSADLGHCLSGILAIYTNAYYLSELQCVRFHPSLQQLRIESHLQVPDLFVRYEPTSLPPALRMMLPGGLKRKPFIKDTIRIAFHGIDTRTGDAIMVAHGSLSSPVKALGILVPKCEDNSLVFQQSGNGFALRKLCPVGQPIVIDLVRTLQRLECALSIVESLRQRKMTPRLLSLSRIAFGYGAEGPPSAVIHIECSAISSKENIDPADILLQTEPHPALRLDVSFDRLSPYRRIQGTLTAILNSESGGGGFDSSMEILLHAIPLLRALDRITANPSRNGLLKVQVTACGAKSFRIHYPAHRFKFQITASQHQNRMTWILRDVSGVQDRSSQARLVAKLKNGLYDCKGDGWRGLGTGAVAEASKIEGLIVELDKCFEVIESVPGATLIPGQKSPAVLDTASKATSGGDSGSGPRVDSTVSYSKNVPAGAASEPRALKSSEPIVIE